MARFSLAFLLLLAACDKPITRAEAESIAEDFSDTTALEARIESLEAEVERLGGSDLHHQNQISANAKLSAVVDRAHDAEVDRLTGNDKAFLAQINYLRALQGLPPMPEEK